MWLTLSFLIIFFFSYWNLNLTLQESYLNSTFYVVLLLRVLFRTKLTKLLIWFKSDVPYSDFWAKNIMRKFQFLVLVWWREWAISTHVLLLSMRKEDTIKIPAQEWWLNYLSIYTIIFLYLSQTNQNKWYPILVRVWSS